jgi:MFS family permease
MIDGGRVRGGPFLRVTLPLAGLNFLNQASRGLLALLAPLLALEFGLSASQLGLLAAALFAAYALAQLPVGLALDLYGARRVQLCLGIVAGLGFVLSAVAGDPILFAVGRVFTGLGVSAGLMAMMKANVQWFPPHRVASATGRGLFVAGLGGLLVTWPVQMILPQIGWRGAFWLLALASVLVGSWIALSVPRAVPGGGSRRALRTEIAEIGRIFAHPRFRRLVPAIAMISALSFTYQGLWAGPWLRDVGGQGDEARALLLLTYAAGLMTGSLVAGQAASFAQARGAGPLLAPYVATGVMLVLQAWLILAPPAVALSQGVAWFLFAFCAGAGPTGYTAVGQGFPAALTGRVATAINFSMLVLVFVFQNGIGWILDLWPRVTGGGWDPRGYAWAMAATFVLQAGAALWLVVGPRDRPA